MIITVTLNPTIDRTLECPGFRVGGHVRARLRAFVPAGKGINVARGLAVLGSRAVVCAFVGRNERAVYSERLEADGVTGHFVVIEGLTRMNTTVLDPLNRTTTHLREDGFEVKPEEIGRMRGLVGGLIEEQSTGGMPVQALFCGSLPRGVRPSDFASMVQECREAGAQVVVDASGDALREAVATRAVHTIKPNLLELSQCLGEQVDPAEATDRASELLDRVSAVLLTMGADGAYAIGKDMKIGLRCPISSCEVRNTVGAGDAFLAGWLRGCELWADPAVRLRWAVAAASACVMAETAAGYSRSDVESLLPRCQPI